MDEGGHSGRAAGGQLEEKVDLTPETDAKLEQSAQLAKGGSLNEALAMLAALEKRCRVGNDTVNLVRVCEASLQYCKDAGDNESLVTTLQTLSTRRSQKTQAVRALVQKAIPWCLNDQYTPCAVSTDEEKADREKLVVTLRDITDGKLFLEAERARLTRALATIKVRTGRLTVNYRCHYCFWNIMAIHNRLLTLRHASLFYLRRKKGILQGPPMFYRKFMWRPMVPYPRRKR